MSNIEVGEKIRLLRKQRQMNIAALAERAELSMGLISQIERNLVSPSITSLWKIANCLGVSIGYFFDEEETQADPVVRRADRKKLFTSSSSAVYELLSANLKNKKIEFLYITIHPGEDASPSLVTHEGEECGVVLKGRLKIKTAQKDYHLEEGDSIYFNSMIPHKYINIGEEPCISVWAMTPPSF